MVFTDSICCGWCCETRNAEGNREQRARETIRNWDIEKRVMLDLEQTGQSGTHFAKMNAIPGGEAFILLVGEKFPKLL